MEKKEFDKAPWIICSKGQVISKKTGKPRIQYKNKNGYPMVNYRCNQTQTTYNYYVHRLVAEMFIGEIPSEMCVNHKDGNKTNNDVSNLEIVTYKENMRHAHDNGLKNGHFGEKNGMGKLKDSETIELIKDILKGLTNDEVAKKYNLHSRYVSLIRHKRRQKKAWEHVERATTIETSER